MELCNGGEGIGYHVEVCYDARHCPLCDIRRDLREKISGLREEIAEKEKQISKLEAQP